jgi:hypothetical protein
MIGKLGLKKEYLNYISSSRIKLDKSKIEINLEI